MSRLITVRVCLLVALSAFIVGCGDGNDNNEPKPGSSDWDSMIWDQDDWA
jgi:hypothetical protein